MHHLNVPKFLAYRYQQTERIPVLRLTMHIGEILTI